MAGFAGNSSPDGGRIVSGSHDGTARVWSADTGTELAVLRGHGGGVSCVAFSPDGGRIVSSSTDDTVRVWDADTGTQLPVLQGHQNRILSMAFSPDGGQIVSSSTDDTVRVWDAAKGDLVEVIAGGWDITAIAAETNESLWRAVIRDGETVVVRREEEGIVARFPEALWPRTTRPSARTCAGGISGYLCLIQFEGR